MVCRYLKNNICEIITKMSGHDVQIIDNRTCIACSAASPPQDINYVTAQTAMYSWKDDERKFIEMSIKYGHIVSKEMSKYIPTVDAIRNGVGVGSELFRLLEEIGITHTAGCKCTSLANKMNKLGPTGCKLLRSEIIADMRDNAKLYGWTTIITAVINAFKSGISWRLNLLDIYGSLIDEAINRVEIAGK